ncbi:MAG: glycosyltransferase [Anaerolineales bacterium]
MRIGMLADIYKPHISGVTIVIEQAQRELQSRGHEVFVFTFGKKLPEDADENIVRSSGIPVPIREPTIQLNFRYSDHAQQVLGTMDILHVHHPFLSGRLALRYGRQHNLPIVFTSHTRYDLYAQAYLPMMPDQIGSGFLHAYLPAFCSEVDMVIAPSAGLKHVLRDLDVESEIRVIPNGIDLEPYRKARSPKPRGSIGLAEENVVLVYSGRLGPEKNLTFLLRAFAGVHEAFPNTRLVLVGKGPELGNLQDFAHRAGIVDEVKFVGLVPHEEVPDYLGLGDLFVTASVTEVHPLSLIEAMATGLPVVGVESPGVGDIVENGETGYLAAHDLASYASKLSRLVADESLRRSMAQRAAERAALYDVKRTTSMLEELYRTLVESQRSPEQPFWRRAFNSLLGGEG